MVETSLRGRPSFGTFLQSDANAGRDGLTYYDYQRFLRSQKVALLQEKRVHTHVPGCKRVALPSSSRKLFQLKNRSPAHAVNETAATSSKCSEVWPADEFPMPKPESNDSKEQLSEIALGIVNKTSESPVHVQSSRMSVTWKSDDPKHNQTDRLPRISAHHHRAIKSATSRDHHSTWPGLELQCHPPRPQTVAGVCDRDIQGIHSEERDKQSKAIKKGLELQRYPPPPKTVAAVGVRDIQGIHSEERDKTSKAIKKEKDQYSGVSEDEHPQVSRQRNLLHLRHAWSECEPTDDAENPDTSPTGRDALAHAFSWGTTTQRAYDEVGWTERVADPVAPPMTTIEQFPDPVSQRLTFRRYHSEPASWQVCGVDWDFAQTRTGSFMKGPLAVDYCTSTRKTQQIPGYLGCIPNQEIMDNPLEESHPALLIRSLKPRPTNISRRLNIPGYTGHVHWAKTSPTHTKPDIWSCTSKRSHGPLPLEDELSPFCRNGIFSKMITTVSPHNPFNRIDL